jgi:deazaflavin-dependent oxidoreductase (nitroreductase family)
MAESDVSGINSYNDKIIADFRTNDGRVGGPSGRADLLLLHHTGARSGTERVNPLAFQQLGESYAIFASMGGGPRNPDWYHNLIAHPETTVEVGGQTVRVRARVAEPSERDVIYARQAERRPQFAEYEITAAPRKIPVVVLDPVK